MWLTPAYLEFLNPQGEILPSLDPARLTGDDNMREDMWDVWYFT